MEIFSGTKKQIFDAAIHLFAANGVEGTSMRDIAMEVGIQSSSIYNHFESKRELLESIFSYYEACFHEIWPVVGRTAAEGLSLSVSLARVYELPRATADKMVKIMQVAVEQSKCDTCADKLVADYLVQKPKMLFRLIVAQMDADKLDELDMEAMEELFACLCFSSIMRTNTSSQIGISLWQRLVDTLLSLLRQEAIA